MLKFNQNERLSQELKDFIKEQVKLELAVNEDVKYILA